MWSVFRHWSLRAILTSKTLFWNNHCLPWMLHRHWNRRRKPKATTPKELLNVIPNFTYKGEIHVQNIDMYGEKNSNVLGLPQGQIQKLIIPLSFDKSSQSLPFSRTIFNWKWHKVERVIMWVTIKFHHHPKGFNLFCQRSIAKLREEAQGPTNLKSS